MFLCILLRTLQFTAKKYFSRYAFGNFLSVNDKQIFLFRCSNFDKINIRYFINFIKLKKSLNKGKNLWSTKMLLRGYLYNDTFILELLMLYFMILVCIQNFTIFKKWLKTGFFWPRILIWKFYYDDGPWQAFLDFIRIFIYVMIFWQNIQNGAFSVKNHFSNPPQYSKGKCSYWSKFLS